MVSLYSSIFFLNYTEENNLVEGPAIICYVATEINTPSEQTALSKRRRLFLPENSIPMQH